MLSAAFRCTNCRRQVYFDPLDVTWRHTDASFDMPGMPGAHNVELPPEAVASMNDARKRQEAIVAEAATPPVRRFLSPSTGKGPYDWAAEEKAQS